MVRPQEPQPIDMNGLKGEDSESKPWHGLRSELPGWDLLWFSVRVPEDRSAVAQQMQQTESSVRRRWRLEALAKDSVVAAIRKLFRAAGCDPTRYRPSSEALLRRVLKGQTLPQIHPLVDLNNCLSLRLVVPCCVLAKGSIAGPLTFRAGREGEEMASLRGPFNLAGKPLLEDAAGPFGTPITDGERVRILTGTQEGYLVAYLPAGAALPKKVVGRVVRELFGEANSLRE